MFSSSSIARYASFQSTPKYVAYGTENVAPHVGDFFGRVVESSNASAEANTMSKSTTDRCLYFFSLFPNIIHPSLKKLNSYLYR